MEKRNASFPGQNIMLQSPQTREYGQNMIDRNKGKVDILMKTVRRITDMFQHIAMLGVVECTRKR